MSNISYTLHGDKTILSPHGQGKEERDHNIYDILNAYGKIYSIWFSWDSNFNCVINNVNTVAVYVHVDCSLENNNSTEIMIIGEGVNEPSFITTLFFLKYGFLVRKN